MKKKVFSLILVYVLIASFLASCASTKTEVNKEATSGTTETTIVPKTSPPSVSLVANAANAELKRTQEPGLYMSDIPNMTAPGVLPIVAEPVTLTLGIPESPNVTDYNDNDLTKWAEEISGINIEFYFFPSAAAEACQKFELLASSGSELPDLTIGVNLTDQARYNLGRSGILLPLDDYFKKYAAFYKESIKYEPENIQETIEKLGISPDGKQYGFCHYSNSPTDRIVDQLNPNKTWIDKLGLDLPTNTDEFYNMLKAFYEKDPNGNGKADEIPLIGSMDWSENVDLVLLNSFIYWNPDGLLVDNGKISAAFIQEDYKQGVTYMNKLCRENLLSPLSFTNKRAQNKPLINPAEGEPLTVGCFTGYHVLHFTAGVQDRKRNYVGLPLLTGPSGKAYATYSQPTISYSGYITKYCKYPEIAFRFLDLMTTQEWNIRARYGAKDDMWKYIEYGSLHSQWESLGYKANKQISMNPAGAQASYFWGGLDRRWMSLAYYGSYAVVLDENIPKQADTMYMDEQCIHTSYMSRNGKQPKEIVGRFIYTEAESLEMSEMKAAIDTYVKESRINFIVGTKNLTTDWDEYLRNLDKMGLKRYLEIIETAYKRMNN